MSDENATEPGLVPVEVSAEKPKRKRRPPAEEAYDSDLEWLLVMGDSVMGERGTLGGTIAVLEHGGQFTGVPSTDLYTDQQVGWAESSKGLVERHRWLSAAWISLPFETRARLNLCYQAPPSAFRSDEGFGARDKCPAVEDIERNRAIEPQLPTVFHHRRGTEARLGRYAALAFRLCENPATLLVACQDPNKRKNAGVISRALDIAKGCAIKDHEAWVDAKYQAPRPRTRRERVAMLPAYTGGDE